MKKIIAMLIATVMLLSVMSVSAFAAEYTTDSTSQDVYAKYAEGIKTDAYKVNISWGSMKFNYSEAHQEWNTDTHQWDTVTAAAWTAAADGANVITVVNHSSKDVTAALGFEATANTGITGGTFTNDGRAVTSIAVGNALGGSAVSEKITFMPTGDLVKTDDNTADFVAVGKITITLS